MDFSVMAESSRLNTAYGRRYFLKMGRHMSGTRATLVGLISVVLWSANVGLIRTVTQALGPVGGAAMLYTLSAALLYASFGFPRLSAFPRRYLYIASALFCVYEICFSLSLGFATSGRQTLELGMVNYLWPSMTIAMAVLVNKQKANWLIVPGMALAIAGIGLVLGGEQGLDLREMWRNILVNPLSYFLAFTGAFLWSVYCTITARMAGGNNSVTFFFMLTALLLWMKYLAGDAVPMRLSPESAALALAAAAALAFGYASWNIGILHGNVTVLSAASYFIPVFSSLLTSFMVGAPLSASFWRGCALTSLGSLLCWISTRTKRAAAVHRDSVVIR